MGRYLVTRLAQAVAVVLVVVTMTFVLIASSPGGLGNLVNPDLAPADAELIRRKLGLDQPAPVQYMRWLGGAIRLDLGDSIRFSEPVIQMVLSRLPATLLLSSVSLVLAVAIALPLGILAARFQFSWIDRLSMLISLFGLSIPVFWLGLIAILIFSVTFRLLPSSGMVTPGVPFDLFDAFKHLVMPAGVLALITTAELMKYTRSSMLTVLHADYLRTARAKGLREQRIVLSHALRNALIPIVTVIGLLLPRLVGGTVVTETIFSWPGMGRLAVDAALGNDYPVVMGVTLLISAVVAASSILVDLLYVYLDPRIRLRA